MEMDAVIIHNTALDKRESLLFFHISKLDHRNPNKASVN